jgi:hypothetical protein
MCCNLTYNRFLFLLLIQIIMIIILLENAKSNIFTDCLKFLNTKICVRIACVLFPASATAIFNGFFPTYSTWRLITMNLFLFLTEIGIIYVIFDLNNEYNIFVINISTEIQNVLTVVICIFLILENNLILLLIEQCRLSKKKYNENNEAIIKLNPKYSELIEVKTYFFI